MVSISRNGWERYKYNPVVCTPGGVGAEQVHCFSVLLLRTIKEFGQQRSNGGSYRSRSGSNGPHIEPPALKSNLKKTTIVDDNQLPVEKRKVSWPDAHGKDIAHVHEFEPSVSEDGELEGVRNSCVCAIQ
ncbi:hypothetical protein FH972_014890 [Carpinus fangiana]|uniref:Uncharacterized protein n=1 Tax=Carpinus fangiana TaxID=176857 RepID=A0A5N6REA8_9ROSI|nr:hypothetical protein FH972_014890 [Carpinus fangiana]